MIRMSITKKGYKRVMKTIFVKEVESIAAMRQKQDMNEFKPTMKFILMFSFLFVLNFFIKRNIL